MFFSVKMDGLILYFMATFITTGYLFLGVFGFLFYIF